MINSFNKLKEKLIMLFELVDLLEDFGAEDVNYYRKEINNILMLINTIEKECLDESNNNTKRTN